MGSIDPNHYGYSFVGSVSGGVWAGSVVLGQIKGANFAFTQQCCYMQVGSKLAIDVLTLFDQGRQQEIGQIMYNLEASLYGFVDPDIVKYLPIE